MKLPMIILMGTMILTLFCAGANDKKPVQDVCTERAKLLAEIKTELLIPLQEHFGKDNMEKLQKTIDEIDALIVNQSKEGK